MVVIEDTTLILGKKNKRNPNYDEMKKKNYQTK